MQKIDITVECPNGIDSYDLDSLKKLLTDYTSKILPTCKKGSDNITDTTTPVTIELQFVESK